MKKYSYLINLIRASCFVGTGFFLCAAGDALALEWSSGLESSGIERGLTAETRDAVSSSGSGASNYDQLSQQAYQLQIASEIGQQINSRESPSLPESFDPEEDVDVGGWFAPPAPDP